MARITVRVTPRSSRDEIVRRDSDGTLHVRVTAPPADGQANVAVGRLLARTLGLPSRDVVLVSGASSRQKLFEVPLDEATVEVRLGLPR